LLALGAQRSRTGPTSSRAALNRRHFHTNDSAEDGVTGYTASSQERRRAYCTAALPFFRPLGSNAHRYAIHISVAHYGVSTSPKTSSLYHLVARCMIVSVCLLENLDFYALRRGSLECERDHLTEVL